MEINRTTQDVALQSRGTDEYICTWYNDPCVFVCVFAWYVVRLRNKKSGRS